MDTNIKVSIIIPYYKRELSEEQLARCIESIKSQTFKDYEIVIVEEGKAAYNVNEGVKRAKGEIIKVICMDDYFTHENALQAIVDAFRGIWLVHGVSNNLNPFYSGDIHLGYNKLGGLSCFTCRRDSWIPLNEDLVWLFDCDWHKQMYLKYGKPIILNGDFVTIQVGEGQATNQIDNTVKYREFMQMSRKYDSNSNL